MRMVEREEDSPEKMAALLQAVATYTGFPLHGVVLVFQVSPNADEFAGSTGMTGVLYATDGTLVSTEEQTLREILLGFVEHELDTVVVDAKGTGGP